MRGKGRFREDIRNVMRITPAYAGKSPAGAPVTLPAEDHPRVYGEKTKKIP